jgi:hypothetical protein
MIIFLTSGGITSFLSKTPLKTGFKRYAWAAVRPERQTIQIMAKANLPQ